MDRQRARDESGKPLRPTRQGIPGNERVLCLDVLDGRVIWQDEYDCPYKVSYPSGPRTTPLVHQGRVYTLGAMGDLRCLDIKTGKPLWKKNLCQEYKTESPVWGYAAHPLIDGDLLYCLVGGEGSAAVAFHKDTGKEVWKALSSQEVGYSPPMIYEAGGKRQLIIWLSDSINGLDPATGKVYWTQAYPASGSPQRPAVNIVTVRRHDDLLFVSTYYNGPMMLKLAAAFVPESLPADMRRRHNLPGIVEALRHSHYPDTREQYEKAKLRLSFEELLCVQLAVLERRAAWQEGRATAFDSGPVIEAYRSALPFVLTGAQERVLAEIVADLGQNRPMARLLQGDVGSGKTAVAGAALAIAVANGYQGALMAPTEILAEQHFRTLNSLLASLAFPGRGPMRVELLTGSLRSSSRRAALDAIAAGEIDVAVGTHALIQEGVAFRRLGLRSEVT